MAAPLQSRCKVGNGYYQIIAIAVVLAVVVLPLVYELCKRINFELQGRPIRPQRSLQEEAQRRARLPKRAPKKFSWFSPRESEKG